MTLYIDEDSGVIRDADEAGEPFFAADGKPSQSISTTMEFLCQIEANGWRLTLRRLRSRRRA